MCTSCIICCQATQTVQIVHVLKLWLVSKSFILPLHRPQNCSGSSSQGTARTDTFIRCYFCGSSALVGLDFLYEVLRSHSDTALGRSPLDELSSRRKDLYLTTHTTHKTQTSMPLSGFGPAIPASDEPQTHAWDRAAAGIGRLYNRSVKSPRQTGLLIVLLSCTIVNRLFVEECG
jgi:hypothetical protein